MSTMRDVARQAGVSVKTVSRVFNDDPHVLPETRQRVEEALAQLNYTPNTLARTFRDGRSPVIGVAVPNIADPFFSSLAKAVETVAAGYDMSVLVSSLGPDPGKEPEVVEALLRRQLGALVMAPTAPDQSYLRRWSEKVALVFVDRPPQGLDADCFTEDDFGGARAATRHLLDHGHDGVAFVGNSLDVSTTVNRLSGYRSALAEAGIAFRPELVVNGATSRDGAWATVARLVGLADAPTAVFSSDAQTSMFLVPALAGSRLSIAGFGDFPMASMLSPALTVVDQDPDALGRLAAERAIRRLDGVDEGAPVSTTLPVRLLERSSCRPVDLEGGLFPASRPDGAGTLLWVTPDS